MPKNWVRSSRLGDPRVAEDMHVAVLAALNHIHLDRICSIDPDFRDVLEAMARLDKRRRRRRRVIYTFFWSNIHSCLGRVGLLHERAH